MMHRRWNQQVVEQKGSAPSAVTRRKFLTWSAGAVMVGAAGSLGLTVFPEERQGQKAYLAWKKRTRGTLSDLQYVVQCGTLAASPHNTQPWKFRIQQNAIQIFADRERYLGHADASWCNMLMAVGCAMENMRVAATHLGYQVQLVDLDADRQFARNGYCATLQLTKVTETSSHPWFHALFDRQTTRTEYDLDYPVPMHFGEEVSQQGVLPGVHVAWIRDPQMFPMVQEVTVASVRQFLGDPKRRHDAMNWFRITRREWEARRDGIAIFTSDAPWYVKEWVERFASRSDLESQTFVDGEIETVMRVSQATPLWMVLCAESGSRNASVLAGCMLERLYLEAASKELAIQPLSYVGAIQDVAVKVVKNLNLSPLLKPLLFLRVGKATVLEKSVRRDLSEVLL